jgi:glycine cleavage system H protein
LTNVPDNLLYTNTHEWVRLSGSIATIGITDFAQEELHEVVYVELPEAGAEVKRGSQFAAVESVKARSEIFSPVSGKVVKVNSALIEGAVPAKPELVNEEPYAGGWLVEIELSGPADADTLLSPDGYRKEIEKKSH